MRSPYAPFASTATLPCGGTHVWNTASTPKVPLPCSRTVSQPASRVSPASFNNCSLTPATTVLNSTSHDPASCSIASFTLKLVVSGPGVKRSLSLAEGSGEGGEEVEFFTWRNLIDSSEN